MTVELATAYVSLVPSAKGIQAAVSKELGRPLEQTARQSGEKTSGAFASTFKKGMAVIGGAFAAVQVGQFFKDAIGGASDLSESLSKVGVVFGSSAPKVEAFAKTAATALGQSQSQALAAAGTFGNLFTALGLTQDKSADMSVSLVTLASDLASFNNVDPAEALDALRSGLVGETEPLKRFGVNMNEATLKAQALKMGLIATEKEALSPAAKAQAAYALILEQTKTAQGDFARTSDGLANKQRILAARFEDIKARIGAALLPVVLKLTTVLADGLGPAIAAAGDFMRPVADFVKEIVAAFKEFGLAGGDFAETLDRLVGGGGRLTPVFQGIFDVALRVASFVRDNFQPILIGLGVAIAALVSPVAVAVGALVLLYARFQTVRDVVAAVIGFVTGAVAGLAAYFAQIWPQISEAVTHVMNVIAGVIRTTIDVVSAWWRAWGDDLWRIVGTVWNGIRETIENALQVVKGVIGTVLALINGDWGKAWDGIKNIVGAVWDQIGNVISTAVGTVRSLIGGLGSTIAEVARGIWDPIREGFKGAVNWIIRAWNGLKFEVPGVDLPGPLGKVGGFTIGVPHINELARGGRFDPGFAITGERGPELALFDRPGFMVNNARLADLLAGRGGAPVFGGDLVLNAAEMRPADISSELAWWAKTSGR